VTAKRVEPAWLDVQIALAVHDRQLAEHGGGQGVRDPALLESALARPRNRWGYGEDDRCALAAAYAYGIARNHPFVDGNKRVAFAVLELFLQSNGLEIVPDDPTIERFIYGHLEAGTFRKDVLDAWLRANTAAS